LATARPSLRYERAIQRVQVKYRWGFASASPLAAEV
jgi:hypothetical protein